MPSNTIKAVIFDIGGVVIGSPLVQINAYEVAHGLPRDYLNVAITAKGHQSAFQRFERSEIDLYTFYREFGRELSQADVMNKWYAAFCQRRGREVPELPKSLTVDGRELFGLMMRGSNNDVDPKMLDVIKSLRATGKYQIAALTNNFSAPTYANPAPGSPSLDEELEHLALGGASARLKSLFDHFIESAVVGLRKPEVDFFSHALEVLRLKGEECAFLDDIGINLSAARKLGIHTIRVQPSSSLPAIRELEKLLGEKLLSDDLAQREEQRLASLPGKAAKL